MHYYIDGYNLLFRLFYNHTSLQKKREEIIQDLSSKLSLLQIPATLVFDSKFMKGSIQKTHVNDLLVVYTSEGETADEWILQAIEHESKRSSQTVVTSDKRLAQKIQTLGSKTLTIETFMLWLNSRISKKQKPKKSFPHKNEFLLKIREAKRVSPPEIGSFEYYLKHFQKDEPPPDCANQAANLCNQALDAADQNNKPKSREILSHKKTEIPLSEQERWQHIFEERLKKESEE